MGAKGENTKQFIRSEAYSLFAQKGYKDVTMKDICEKTGLSRGGLYRHYKSTGQIFLEIIHGFLDNQQHEFQNKIAAQIPASQILDEVMTRYEEEMLDSENSLTIAILEFFSNPQIPESENLCLQQYTSSKHMWIELIEYGIQQGEFKAVEPDAVFDLIVFSYQGIRMYSKMMKLDPNTPKRITGQIKSILLV